MTQLILLTGLAIALLAVVISVRHMSLAFAARKTFVDVLAKWLSEDYAARDEAERILSYSPDELDSRFREQLLKKLQCLPDRVKKEIMSGLENNSREGRSTFLASILSDVLTKSKTGVQLDEADPPYEAAGAASSWGSRLAPVWSGAAGFAIGGVAAAVAVAVLGDESRLPKELVELQRRAEEQEIARQVNMLTGSPVFQPIGEGVDGLAERVAVEAMRAAKEGKGSVNPQDVLWRLKRVGDLYLRTGDYDKARTFLGAATKVASEFDLKTRLGSRCEGFTRIWEIYTPRRAIPSLQEVSTRSR